MPEVILPCPAWACQGELVECKQDGENFFIECTECSMRGPVECDPYHAQQSWDWIPRALLWTTEPPKVAGWHWYHWRSGKGQNMTMIQTHIFNGVCGYWDGNGVFRTDLNRGEWAGPIPAPID